MSRMIQTIEYGILAFSLAVMSILTFANVISRYFLNSSIAFTQEITLNLFVLLTFMGSAIGIHRKGHLGFNLLFDSLKGRWKIILTIFIGIIISLIFIVVLYFGIKMILFQKHLKQTTAALGWPQWIFSLGLPLGSLFCVIRTIEATGIEVKNILQERGSS